MTGMVTANLGIPSAPSHYDGTEEMDYWDKETKEDFPTRGHNANCEKKKRLVKEVVLLTEQGYKTRKIAEKLGISHSTVKKYQPANFNPVSGCYHTTTESKIKPYADEIKKMLGKGNTFKEIEEEIREKGYDGAASTIRMYTTRERKLRKEAQKGEQGTMEKIDRKWLISLLYKPLDKVKGIIQEQLDIEEINTFINGVRRDQSAVEKAIELDYNNGLAEGSVNKLKVVKRIMYGAIASYC